jgi:hypothetical protein
VNCPEHFVAAERRDDALDLPPVAETRDIAVVAAPLGESRRFEAGVVAESLDQIRCVGKGVATVDEEALHATFLKPGAVSRLPTNVVNGALTMLRAVTGAPE